MHCLGRAGRTALARWSVSSRPAKVGPYSSPLFFLRRPHPAASTPVGETSLELIPCKAESLQKTAKEHA